MLVDTALFVQCCLTQQRIKERKVRVSFRARIWGSGKKPSCLIKMRDCCYGSSNIILRFFFKTEDLLCYIQQSQVKVLLLITRRLLSSVADEKETLRVAPCEEKWFLG